MTDTSPNALRQLISLGDLDVLFADGDVRYLRVAGVEVLRRIYLAVREPGWGTVVGTIAKLERVDRPGGVRIRFQRSDKAKEIELEWDVEIDIAMQIVDGGMEAEISYSAVGLPRTSFRTARTGVCILHPLAGCAGQACVVEHTSGAKVPGTFPELIAPHQPFKSVRGISHEPAAGLRVEARFDGEVFETEDQRNWTDGSFKTYSRLLTEPTPYELTPQHPVRQSVKVKISGRAASQGSKKASIVVGGEMHRLPPIGVGLPDTGGSASPADLAMLKSLRPAHLQVVMRRQDAAERLAVAMEMSGALNAPLELFVRLPKENAEETAALIAREIRGRRDAMGAKRLEIARVIVAREGKPSATPADLQMLTKALEFPIVEAGIGTVGNFSDINRNRPPRDWAGPIAWGVNPQVHAVDDLSLIENLEGLADTLRTARSFSERSPLWISAAGIGFDAASPRAVRQHRSALLRAWTLSAIGRIARAGAASITIHRTHGPGGLVADGAAIPAAEALQALAGLGGSQLRSCISSAPLEVDALAFVSNGLSCLLVTSLCDRAVEVEISGLDRGKRTVQLEPYGLKALTAAD